MPMIDERMFSNTILCEKCNKFFNLLEKRVCCGIDHFEIRRKEMQMIIDPPLKASKNKMEKREKKNNKRSRQNLSPEIKQQVLKRDKGRCVKCGSKQELHVHHKIHRSDGGSDNLENLETLCFLCHAEEHRGEPVYNIMIKSLFVQQSLGTT